MEPKEEVFTELTQRIEAFTKGGTCIIHVNNRTPSNLQIAIGGACTFTYQKLDESGALDGVFTDYHTEVNVGSGQALSFQSDRPQSCVKKIQVAVVMKSPLTDEVGHRDGANEVANDDCILSATYTIGNSKTVKMKDLSSGMMKKMELVILE